MSIRKHLPPKDAYKSLQVKMETTVVEEVKIFMKLDGISWNDLLTACFKKYLEESKVEHSGKISIESSPLKNDNDCIRNSAINHPQDK